MAALAEFVDLDRSSWAGLPLPLTLRLPVPLSDEELIAFSRQNQPYRVEMSANGELEIMSPLGGKGGRGESYLIGRMEAWADVHGGESFSSNTGFRLPDGSRRCADVAWLSADRWNSLSDAEQTSLPPLCPDFLVELLSVSDSRKVLEAKMQIWMDNGAKLAWMIDPHAGDVTIYRAGYPSQRLVRPDLIEADTVVAGLQVKTEKLWLVRP